MQLSKCSAVARAGILPGLSWCGRTPVRARSKLDGLTILVPGGAWARTIGVHARRSILVFSGGLSAGDPPVPIPNTAAKLCSADNTEGATLWENRTPPEKKN